MLQAFGKTLQKQVTRGVAAGRGEVRLSTRRVPSKIKLGKSRPAIFYQFDTLVELSDGSVVKRRSQAPKDEIRMITDQRSVPFWNPHRSDLSGTDLSAAGKIARFNKKFGDLDGADGEAEPAEAEGEDAAAQARARNAERKDRLFDLFSENAEEVAPNGKVQDKYQRNKKKK